MKILKEEVLVKVNGGANEIQNITNSCIDGVKDGFIKDLGPLSVVRGLAQLLDSAHEFSIPNRRDEDDITHDFCNGGGKIVGGIAQTYVVVKVVKFAYNKLSKNEHIKKFFS